MSLNVYIYIYVHTSSIQGPGSWIQDHWSWIQDFGLRILDAGSSALDLWPLTWNLYVDTYIYIYTYVQTALYMHVLQQIDIRACIYIYIYIYIFIYRVVCTRKLEKRRMHAHVQKSYQSDRTNQDKRWATVGQLRDSLRCKPGASLHCCANPETRDQDNQIMGP